MGETDRSSRRFSDVGDWIARVGIPAAIAFVLLFQTNQRLDKVSAQLERLTIIMETKGAGK